MILKHINSILFPLYISLWLSIITLALQNNLANFEHLKQMLWASVTLLASAWVIVIVATKKNYIAQHWEMQKISLLFRDIVYTAKSLPHPSMVPHMLHMWVSGPSKLKRGPRPLPNLLGKWCSHCREISLTHMRFLQQQCLCDAYEGQIVGKRKICVKKAVRFHLNWKSAGCLLCVLPLVYQPG